MDGLEDLKLSNNQCFAAIQYRFLLELGSVSFDFELEFGD
jgi:hypothetical protein